MTRLFRGLRDRPPRERYDAVVIGAGIGGLVCANLLAKDGLRVLLVEQHYMAGGYCSTFRRAHYTFDAATHFYPLLGNSQTLTGRLLADLGVETRWVKMDPVDTFHFPDGERFDVPADLDRYLVKVKAAFPHESDRLDRFFAEVREAYQLGLLAYFREREKPGFDRLAQLSLTDVLDRHIRDPKLKLLLTADCPHWGSAPSDTSFVFDSMLRLSYFLGNYYPVGGSQAFADELARCFEERGGEILMSTRAERILVEEQRVAGVELVTGVGKLAGRHRVAAEAVVSNADLDLTYRKLLGPSVVGQEALEELSSLTPSYPCFISHLGVVGVDRETLEEVQGYHWSNWDPDTVGREGLICKVFAPTLYEPRMAPPGGQVILLQKVLEMDYASVVDWSEHKREIESRISAHLERLIPGISERIVVQTSATARTMHRFTQNLVGAMVGWEMSPAQLGDCRPGIEGPVEGLTLVGHWVRPGGGITPVIVSALDGARRVLGSRDADPRDPRR